MHAFFDDSGDFGGGGFFCLAGYIANVERWNAFSQEWWALLEKTGADHLHTSDFLAGKGDFAGLQLDYSQRVQAIRDFGIVIRKHVYSGFAVGVDGAAYRETLSDLPKKVSAEEFCFERLLSRIHGAIGAWDAESEFFECTFDDSEKTAQKFLSIWQRIKRHKRVSSRMLTAISFADDKFVLPLQAADLLACALTQEVRKGENKFGPDSPFHHLMQDVDPNFGIQFEQEYWDAAAIGRRRDELRKVAVARPQGGSA